MTAKVRGTIRLGDAPLPPGWDRGANAWDVELRYRRRKMRLDFFTGSALSEPSIASIVESLLSDSTYEDSTHDGFCADFGYDPDSRSIYALWEKLVDLAKRFRFLLGDDASEILDSSRYDDDPLDVARKISAEEWSER